MSTTTTNPTSIRDDVARLVTLKAQAERIDEEISLINERLRALDYGTHDAGDWSVQVSVNRRLDADRFTQRFPVAQYPTYYRAVPDTKAIQDNFAPVELDQWYVSGAPRVSVK